MRKTNLIILLVAIVMGGLAALMARSWIQTHTTAPAAVATDKIVVANAKLTFGAQLTRDNMTEVVWPKAQVPDGAFTSMEDVLKEGRRYVLGTVEKNEPLLRSKMTEPGQRASLSALLDEGQRAVTVRVDDVRGVAGLILPNDRVDVVLIRTESKQGEEMTLSPEQAAWLLNGYKLDSEHRLPMGQENTTQPTDRSGRTW